MPSLNSATNLTGPRSASASWGVGLSLPPIIDTKEDDDEMSETSSASAAPDFDMFPGESPPKRRLSSKKNTTKDGSTSSDRSRFTARQHDHMPASSSPHVISFEIPHDLIYDSYLSRTLGHALPDCLEWVMAARPDDPIAAISDYLFRMVKNQVYYKERLRYSSELREKKIIHEKAFVEKSTYLKMLRRYCLVSDFELKTAREDERKANLWLMKNLQDCQQTKGDLGRGEKIAAYGQRLVTLGMTKSAIKNEMAKKNVKGNEGDVLTPAERLMLQGRIEEIKKQERDEQMKKYYDQQAAITEDKIKSMHLRLTQAHINSAKIKKGLYVEPVVLPEPVRPGPSTTRIIKEVEDEIEAHSRNNEEEGDEKREQRDSQQIEEEIMDEVLDISLDPTQTAPQRKVDSSEESFLTIFSSDDEDDMGEDDFRLKRVAQERKRLLRTAIERGDYRVTKAGLLRVYVPRCLRVHDDEPDDSGIFRRGPKQIAITKPKVWAARQLRCEVFMDPELYNDCDVMNMGLPQEELALPSPSPSQINERGTMKPQKQKSIKLATSSTSKQGQGNRKKTVLPTNLPPINQKDKRPQKK